MAAGQYRVSRRRVFDGYSRKENSQYRNGGGRDVEPRNSSKFWSSRSNQDGFGGTRKELGVFSSGIGFDDAPVSGLGLKGGEIPASEDGAESHPQKKTKFSPIIWDKKEKEVRVSSKNRVVMTVALSSPVLSPPRLSTRVSECSSDGSDSKSPMVLGLEDLLGKAPAGRGLGVTDVSGFPPTLSPLHSENNEGGNQKGGGQTEKEDCFPTRNISTSRWASACDSPMGGANLVVDSMMSSPESGEFLGEGSERVNHGSSVSDDGHSVGSNRRDGCSENESFDDDSMDIDDKNVGAEQLNSDSEDDIDFQGAEEPVRRNINMLQGCRSVFEYEKLNRISEGTYGVVYRARDKKTGEIVALKKVKMGMVRDGGFPLSALREINILLSIQHPSVVNVKEVVMGDLDSVFMVMEYMEHDLKGMMEKMKHPFSISEVKCLMQQLLEGVKYLHDDWVLHRDLKTSNLLVNNKGELKICDMGMSRQYGSPLKPFTSLVVTLWYRAPELLLGTEQYSTAIDMWSVGCIMAELLAKKPLFAGETEVSQLDKIFEVLGAPNESNWPGYFELPGPGVRVNFKAKQPHNQLRKKFPAASFTGSPALSESGFDLLKKLLAYDPEKRISAEIMIGLEKCLFPNPKISCLPFPLAIQSKRVSCKD